MAYVPTLKTEYRERIVAALMKEFGYKSVMQCPKLEKIVVNQGMGQAVADKKLIDVAQEELTRITGQKAVQTKSRKDISNFKLRKGYAYRRARDAAPEPYVRVLGASDRRGSAAYPRLQGYQREVRRSGQLHSGYYRADHLPEIDIDKITKIFGMEITFVTTAATDQEAYALLREFGLPFKNAKKNQ